MTKIYLSLVFHNHQPVGNLDSVLREAYEKAYLPLVQCLERHPTIKVTLHYTGPLIDWLKIHQPDYLQLVRGLVERGQVEILSGGYYEPILAMLQDSDKMGQIYKLNQEIETLFGTKPKGMWLAERIWEPYFAKPLAEAGMDYTFIDDAHFMAAGFTPDQLFGYFVTEEQGYPLKLVPTQTHLRYSVLWKSVSETIAWLREQGEKRNKLGFPTAWAVMADDGEKFGLWPETFDTAWTQGWMDRFFEAIEANDHWLQTIHPEDYITQYRAWGRAYIPTASYMEMAEWALPSPQSWYLKDMREQYEVQLQYIPSWDEVKRREIENILLFLRGSFWRNFLVKYPEINHMHKRGLNLSQRLHQLPDSDLKQQALNAVWASQCNCAYWHGVFGGVYLFHIRSANYANLIRAEILTEQMEDKPPIWLEHRDFNADSYDEILTANGQLTVMVEPANGGIITELDYRPALFNIANIMSRHPEGYHIQIREAAETHMLMTPGDDRKQFEGEPVRAKEKGLENHIHTDWHRRGMFVDHFFGEGTNLQTFYEARYDEQGDYTNQAYQAESSVDGEQVTISLKRTGGVWVGTVHLPVLVEKCFILRRNSPEVVAEYKVTNEGYIRLSTRFGVETSMGYDGGDNREYNTIVGGEVIHGLGEVDYFDALNEYKVISERHGIQTQFNLSKPATLWHFPLAPITLSEGGFERVHQGMVLLQWWRLVLEPSETWTGTITINLSQRDKKA